MICSYCKREMPDDATHCEKCKTPAEGPWSKLELALFMGATVVIPLSGFIVGTYGSLRQKKKKQGIFLLIFALINLLVSNYISKYV